jgi:hypothetical protein
MLSATDTAYPVLKPHPSERELNDIFAISESAKQRFTALLSRQPNERRTGWDKVKAEPGQPTAKRIKQFLAHLEWLEQEAWEGDPLAGIPTVKLNRFAAEARALNAARMNLVAEQKRMR